MVDSNRRFSWLLALGVVVLSLVVAVVAKLVFQPADARAPTPRAEATRSRPPTPALADPAPTPRQPVPVEARSVAAPEPVAKAEPGPACTQSADCRGAKTADCVVATCEAGHCVFDRSSCECALDEECDDGVECTRDLCFAATKKCIHIRSACK